VRWFRGPIGQQLSALAGHGEQAAGAPASAGNGHGPGLADGDARLLWLVIEGRTNREIARELGLDEKRVARRLTEIYASLGVSTRAGAAVVAFRQGIG
jgi:DNA-binding NarL/FixJ family response regulator